MKDITVGFIRVMTLPEDKNHLLEQQLKKTFPNIRLLVKCIPNQPEGVHSKTTYNTAESKVVEVARDLEGENVAAIYVNCAADPGVALARQRVRVPVFGAGSCSALVAKSIGMPVGVLGISKEPPQVIREVLGSLLVASSVPQGVRTALDLGKKNIIRAGIELKNKGAKCILLGCTGMSLLSVDRDLQVALSVPVVDSLTVSMAVMSYCLSDTHRFKGEV